MPSEAKRRNLVAFRNRFCPAAFPTPQAVSAPQIGKSILLALAFNKLTGCQAAPSQTTARLKSRRAGEQDLPYSFLRRAGAWREIRAVRGGAKTHEQGLKGVSGLTVQLFEKTI
jgi:hypothetical protein